MLAVPCACEVVRVCGYSSPIAKHGVKLNSQQFSLLALSISTIERKRKRDDFMKFNPFPIIDVSSYHSFLFDSYLLILFLLLLLLSITKSLSISLSLINFFPTQKLNNRVSMGEKVTIMILKVDLQCPCCYKKVKKILCKFPQIRDRMFNEKANTVTITVVCCNPEKIRDKLCCKGRKVIKSIEIVDPRKSKQNEHENTTKHKDPVDNSPKTESDKQPDLTLPPSVLIPQRDPVRPWGCQPVYPVRTCCGPCSEGYGGGPCYYGFGVAEQPPPPPPCYGGYGYHDRPCHVTRCDYYFNEGNSQSCSIM